MSRLKKIGVSILISGIIMLLIGGSMFTYSGPRLNPAINIIGAISFFSWLPAIIVGIAIITWPQKKKK